MHLIVEMGQRPVGNRPNAPTRWTARLRQGAELGSDLLKGRYITDAAEAELEARKELKLMLDGYSYSVEFV